MSQKDLLSLCRPSAPTLHTRSSATVLAVNGGWHCNRGNVLVSVQEHCACAIKVPSCLPEWMIFARETRTVILPVLKGAFIVNRKTARPAM